MSDDPPQFFQTESRAHLPRTSPRSDRAIYSLPRKDKYGKAIVIAVECVEGAGNIPRNAAFRDLQHEIGIEIEREFQSVVAVADSVLDALKTLKPGEVEIEFGVELGGKLGIPLITQGEAKANFKVTLKWSKRDASK